MFNEIFHEDGNIVKSQARNARVTINAVHPGIVKTGIIRAHKGLITGNYNQSSSYSIF